MTQKLLLYFTIHADYAPQNAPLPLASTLSDLARRLPSVFPSRGCSGPQGFGDKVPAVGARDDRGQRTARVTSRWGSPRRGRSGEEQLPGPRASRLIASRRLCWPPNNEGPSEQVGCSLEPRCVFGDHRSATPARAARDAGPIFTQPHFFSHAGAARAGCAVGPRTRGFPGGQARTSAGTSDNVAGGASQGACAACAAARGF